MNLIRAALHAAGTVVAVTMALSARADYLTNGPDTEPPARLESRVLTIAPSDLSQALLALGQQARISIVFPKDITEAVHSQGLDGTFTVAEALDRLIGEACLGYSVVSERLIAVHAGCEVHLAATPAAMSAEPYPPADHSAVVAGIEEIIVRDRAITGSRIRMPNPVHDTETDIIDQAAIDDSGVQAVGELLRFLPSVAGNSTSTLISNGGDGTATVTLRGLPSSNTLVLINGRRINPDAFLGKAVDLNTIPLGLIERIEVLKDGASAIYGSDAIAGVVNLITRDQAEGLRIETSYGGASRGDLDTTNSSITYGHDVDLGSAALHANLGVNYYDQKAIFSRDRKRSESSDGRRDGGIDKRSSATVPARITLPSGPVILAEESLDGSDPSHFRPATDEDLFEYRDVTVSVVPAERWTLFSDLRAAFANDLEIYGEAIVTDTEAESTLAQTPLMTGFEYLPLPVAADNRYNPFGIELTDVRRRITELSTRDERHRSLTRRVVAGVTFPVGASRWDISVADNRTESDQNARNLLHAFRTQLALGPDDQCVDGCVPLNLFGPPGSVTKEMLSYLEVDTHNEGVSTLQSAAINIDFPLGRLPAGTIEVASGAEYRDEALETDPDPLVGQTATIGGANFGPTDGDRGVWEAYMEVLLPLIRDRPFIDSLDLQVANRFSHYSDFGKTSNPKFTLRYAPSPSALVRVSYASGFRAPTLHQLFTSETVSFDQLNDPCALAENVGVLPGCTRQSDPTLQQFVTVRGGDRDLRAESASTITAGVALTPESLPGLSASVDYYWISARDVVDANAQFIVNENARSGQLEDRVIRDAAGNLTRVIATALNIGSRDVNGLDIRIVYDIESELLGGIEVAFNATHIRSFRDQLDPGTPARDQAGTFTDEASSGNGALPDWKANVGFTWHRRGWQIAYNVHYVSDLEETIPTTDTTRTIDSWRVHNVQLSYLGPITRWTRISLGANNLFDATPPYSAAAFNDNYDARTYDITGRYVYAQVVKDL